MGKAKESRLNMMYYKKLKKDLLELMHQGTPISLKSLVNSVYKCNDVKYVSVPGVKKLDLNDPPLINYTVGYILSRDNVRMFNNAYIEIEDKNEVELGVIWFGRIDWLSLEMYKLRDGTDIESNLEVPIDYNNDIVNIIALDGSFGIINGNGEDRPYANEIFTEEELQNVIQ